MSAGDEHVPEADQRPGLNRRTVLKTAAATGAGLAAWSAPHIETLGFAPAGAATPCTILSPETQDKNSQSGQNFCPTFPDPSPRCCGQSFGNAGNIDRFTFTNPAPGCTQIVVRTISLNCVTADTQPERNPDVGQFALVIESTTGTCGGCTVLEGVLVDSTQRTELQTLNNGPSACLGGGVDASIIDCETNANLESDSRLAVRITCIAGNPGCVSS